MLSDITFPPSEEYRTGTENEPLTFYMEALVESVQLDLLLGYFSSSAIRVLAVGFAKFISNGGRVRLVINHILSEQDKEVLLAGESGNGVQVFTLADFRSIRQALDSYGEHFFSCLAWLIASKRVQIRAIKPKHGRGIAHYKSGIFSDGQNKVKFKGSCNFTASGLLENLEELDIKTSWKAGDAAFKPYEQEYEQLFSGTAEHAELIPFANIETVIVGEFGGKDIDELLKDEQQLITQQAKQLRNQTHQKAIQKVLQKIDTYLKTPRFPYESGPRPYQQEAFQNWLNNDCKGIFAMATGTGKTITSLNCVLNESLKSGHYQAIIIVPTTVLVEQWSHECRRFNFRSIITVSGQSAGWPTEMSRITTQLSFGVPTSFVIIVTYRSFTNAQFQTYVKRLPTTTILLADEAHNIGSPSVAKLLDGIHLQKRIGLSATPKRIYDPEGSAKMEAFFGDEEPYTYSFSMERAIDEGILCPYYYYPKLVRLTPDEMVKYAEISAKLAKAWGKGDEKPSARAEALLMERKRIIHKAHNKLEQFERILHEILDRRGRIDYTLVYAPEGYYADDERSDEAFSDLTEENRIIDYYASVVRQVSPTTTLTQYTSNSEGKELTLKQFEQGQINALLSMKCLDEGVDIPRTEQAIFCSSTGNPRQFIQRRGRILRTHPAKSFAYIYDMVVIPRADPNSPTFQMERNLVRKELERVVHFAFMAENKYEATNLFRDVCASYDLNLDTIHTDLIA